MRLLITCLFLIVLVSCQLPGPTDKAPEAVVSMPQIEPENPAEIPSNEPPSVLIDTEAGRKIIFDIVVNSACFKAEHGHDQGQAPSGYMKGIALSYMKAICNGNDVSTKVASQPVGDPSRDALAYYGLTPSTEAERLQTVYSLMIGSAAQETSWRWCMGRDVNAKSSDQKDCLNGTGGTCEAGLYQTSYNSHVKHSVLNDLIEFYSKYPVGCFAPEYKGKTTCAASQSINNGTDPKAVNFQHLSKECPGFATEYHSVMLRVNRSHYGPINAKYAEMKRSCVLMFDEIRQLVLEEPNLCYVL